MQWKLHSSNNIKYFLTNKEIIPNLYKVEKKVFAYFKLRELHQQRIWIAEPTTQ